MNRRELEITPKTSLIKKFIKECLILVVIMLIGVLFTRNFVGFVSKVSGYSMSPTLTEGNIAIVSRLSYIDKEPEVGDIIIAIEPVAGVSVIKRVAGVPGDTVTYQDKEYILKENEYFIRGDNKGFTTDSDTYGPISRDRIVGKVVWHN